MQYVTRSLFIAVAEWCREQSILVSRRDAESWYSAPDSQERSGRRALDRPAGYNRLSDTLLARWRVATQGEYALPTLKAGYSDRTGEFTMVAS